MINNSRVAIISNTSWSIYNFRRELIVSLQGAGYTVICIAPIDQFTEKISAELNCEFFPLHHLEAKGSNLFQDLKLIAEFRSLFKRTRIHVVVSYTAKPNIYGNLGALGLPITIINTVNGLGEGLAKNNWLSKLLRFLYRMAFKKSTFVFFQNPDDKNYFLTYGILKAGKTTLVNGSGVDLERFSEKQHDHREHSQLVFLMSARLVKEKGLIEFMEAAISIKKKYPEVTFLISGIKSQGSGDLEKQLSSCDAITYLGPEHNMNSLLERTDVLLLPSYYREGIPRVLLEGLSKGIPIITTDNVGCKETVREGWNGYCIPVRNVESLIHAILKIIESPNEQRIQMGKNSRKLAEKKFDVHAINAVYLRHINQCNESICH